MDSFCRKVFKGEETENSFIKDVVLLLEMANNCKHFVEPFFGVFSEPKKPTEDQIREYKLYQCGGCHRWVSFLDKTEGG